MQYPNITLRSVILLFSSSFFLLACGSSNNRTEEDKVKTVSVGAEILLERYLDDLKGQRVGLVMNPTARVDGTHMLDTLLARNVNITALFAPEHGFRGEAGAGEVIEDGVDRQTGLPVYSLYGETKKPTSEMLQDIDILLFDMQDVGARFYTYNVTLGLLLEAAAGNGIPVWVLDRPNPAGGEYVAGWILEEQYKSFVGAYPIPMAHGMTLGELAKMMVGEGWLDVEKQPELRVIPLEGWQRSMKWQETGLDWYPPSPNLPAFEHAYMYLGTVLFEGTNISEGRGTADPFLKIGAPFIKLNEDSLRSFSEKFPAVSVEQTTFTPQSLTGKSLNPKFKDEQCFGVKINVTDVENVDPVKFGVGLLEIMLSSSGEAVMNDFIYKLAGSKKIESFDTSEWQEDIKTFKEKRGKYLLYD